MNRIEMNEFNSNWKRQNERKQQSNNSKKKKFPFQTMKKKFFNNKTICQMGKFSLFVDHHYVDDDDPLDDFLCFVFSFDILSLTLWLKYQKQQQNANKPPYR